MVSTIPTPNVTGRHLIAGRWQPANGNVFESRSPARWDEVVGIFPRGAAGDANRAIAAARDAFPPWRRTSRIYRAELFDNLAQLVKRDADRLAELMARECGKVVTECKAEVIEGLHMIQYVFGTGRMPIGEVVASEIPEKDAFMRRKPWGVVAVITPWNFPFAVPL
jgi:aldehyde dehydrogenase (NAD+)